MGSKILRQLRLPGVNTVPRCNCHSIPSCSAEAQVVMNAMREDALNQLGLDVKMKRLDVCSYLDKPSDQDDDIQLPPSLSPDSVLELCNHHLRHQPLPITRNFTELQSSFLFGETLRVFQWNMLAQALGKENDNFVRCCPTTFDWRLRRWRIVEEILRHDPDIVCLQELDHPKLMFKVMQSIGYTGRFLHKPDSPCIYLPNNNGPDGCAIFFKSAKFDLISWVSRVLRVWDVASNQVVLGAVLRSKHSGQEALVATTHLKAKFGELRASFRTEQSKDILKWLETVRGGRPIILAGDFNGPPSEEFYSVLTSNKDVPMVSSYNLPKDGDDSNTNEVVPAVPTVDYTTWKIRETGEQKHVLDYILHTPGQMETLRTLEIPDGRVIGEDRLPSTQFPSDHMSLVSDISLISYIN